MKKLIIASLIGVGLYASTNVELMYSALKFNYKEYSGSGVMDEEKSKFNDLKGINLLISQDINKFKLTFNVEYNKGSTKYTDFTWDGTPLQLTENNAYLYNARFIGGYLLGMDETRLGYGKVYLDGGLGYRFWNRGKSNYAGDYDEKYKWKYWLIGININENFNKFNFDLNFYYHKAIQPKMNADLYGGTDFKLGTTKGYRIEIPIRYNLAKNYGIMFKYIYDYWKINQSETVTKDGVSMYEPDSKTKNQYMDIGLFYKF